MIQNTKLDDEPEAVESQGGKTASSGNTPADHFSLAADLHPDRETTSASVEADDTIPTKPKENDHD